MALDVGDALLDEQPRRVLDLLRQKRSRIREQASRGYRDIIAREVTLVAQLVVRSLEDSVKDKLRRRAARRRRSLEAEVRDILRDAVARSEPDERPLGSRIASRFAGLGATLDFPESRGHPARPARFKS